MARPSGACLFRAQAEPNRCVPETPKVYKAVGNRQLLSWLICLSNWEATQFAQCSAALNCSACLGNAGLIAHPRNHYLVQNTNISDFAFRALTCARLVRLGRFHWRVRCWAPLHSSCTVHTPATLCAALGVRFQMGFLAEEPPQLFPLPGLASIGANFAADVQAAAEAGKFKVHKIAGDGRCMFRATVGLFRSTRDFVLESCCVNRRRAARVKSSQLSRRLCLTPHVRFTRCWELCRPCTSRRPCKGTSRVLMSSCARFSTPTSWTGDRNDCGWRIVVK
jgi:hypothetical protein